MAKIFGQYIETFGNVYLARQYREEDYDLLPILKYVEILGKAARPIAFLLTSYPRTYMPALARSHSYCP